MFGIVVSAFNTILAWVLRGVVIKFAVFSAIYYVVTELVNAALAAVDISPVTNMQSAINGIPTEFLYFFGAFRLDIGLPMILAAQLAAFIIRRLPIIG